MVMCGKIASTDDAALASIPTFHPNGALPMVTPAAIGAVLVLIGLLLFVVDLGVTNHGLPAAGGVVALLAGGLTLLWAGVPYSGVLLGAIVAVAMLMGGVLFGMLGASHALRGRRALTGKEGMVGEVGTVRSPVGAEFAGWVFVHGERWRAVLAFAPEDTDPRGGEPMLGVGSKVTVVGFGEGGTVQVIPVERTYHSRSVDLKG
jgi:membrane-bound ClpP family serine protease